MVQTLSGTPSGGPSSSNQTRWTSTAPRLSKLSLRFLLFLALAHKGSPEATQRRPTASHLIRFQNDNAALELGRRPGLQRAR